MAAAADECNQSIASLLEGLNSSYELQKPLEVYCSTEEIKTVPEDKRRAAELLLHDFQDSGTLLPQEDRVKYLQVQNDIIQSQALFQAKAFDPAIYPVESISQELKSALEMNGAGQTVHHEGHHFMIQYDWLRNNSNRQIRQESYVKYHQLSESTDALNQLISARQRMANMLGFESYADRALQQAAPRSVDELEYFLLQLSSNFRPFVELEKNNLSADDPNTWDLTQLKPHVHQKYAQNRPLLRRYLNFHDAIDGFSKITQQLFKVKLERVQPHCPSEVWHKDVLKYEVTHLDEGDYGVLYIDPYQRHDKRASDCQFTIQCGKQLEDRYQNPIIVCSFSLDPNSAFSQISFEELKTIFHELGHAIHSFLGRTRYQVRIRNCRQNKNLYSAFIWHAHIN